MKSFFDKGLLIDINDLFESVIEILFPCDFFFAVGACCFDSGGILLLFVFLFVVFIVLVS
jgi:hypothetical protein